MYTIRQKTFPLNGTYIVHDGYVEDYAAKWSFGYIVGLRGTTVSVPTMRLLSETDLHNYAALLKDRHIGTWADGDTLYIDVWKHIDTLSEALAEARMRGHKAIWDLREWKEISVDEH